jgi:hypothetical protein
MSDTGTYQDDRLQLILICDGRHGCSHLLENRINQRLYDLK